LLEKRKREELCQKLHALVAEQLKHCYYSSLFVGGYNVTALTPQATAETRLIFQTILEIKIASLQN
jgi:hypothetical protein